MSGWGAIYNNTVWSLKKQMSKIARSQEQVASGLRVNRASDDPANASRIFQLKSQKASLETYRKNLDEVADTMDMSYEVVHAISEHVSRVHSLLTQAASGTYSQSNREAIGEEIDSILNQIASLANTKYLGKYIMGGTSVHTEAYDFTRENGRIVRADYVGSQFDLPVPVAPGVTFSGIMVGSDVFASNDRQEPIFYGDTGAAAGSATSTVRGDTWLQIGHLATNYAANPAGVAAGTDSAGKDTIVGAHTLDVDTDNLTISLDGGGAVSYAGTETNLKVTNSAGQSVYVDTTGIAGGMGVVTVNLTADARMSIDDGDTWTNITAFADNQAVTHGTTGRTLYVDTTNVAQTGLEAVSVEGTHDVFSTLMNIRDLLFNTHQLPEGEQVIQLGNAVHAVQEVHASITKRMTFLGGEMQALDTLGFSLDGIKESANEQVAQLQDADIVAMATEIARFQTLYEMTMATSSRLLNLSLLDYI